MIQLTRLNGNPLTVNCDLIKYAEASPDTMLTLLTGEKVVVRESCEEVIARAIQFRARVLSGLATADAASVSPKFAVDAVTNVRNAQQKNSNESV
ncbi:MAG TPA: flagellar FlbD family protein [Acidobacteriaceae bacterium]|nr:flagellar FlbD family protein [Acidobacteriaceae bacterium]